MKLSKNKIIAITVVLTVLACVFAVYLRLFTGKELWYEMFAAMLGTIITAIITMILLRGQSDTDIERERAAKIFEEKLRIYEEFLHILCDVIKDHSLSDEEKIRLEFQTSYVAMHCDSKYIATVSNAVRELIEYECPDEEKAENLAGKSNSPDPLLDNLFAIVEAFRKDLYGDDFKFDGKYKLATLENFSDAYRNAKGSEGGAEDKEQRLSVDLNVLSMPAGVISQPTKTVDEAASSAPQDEASDAVEDKTLWDEAVARWNGRGWRLRGLTGQDGWMDLSNDANPGVVIISRFQGRYCIKAAYGNDPDFSKPLKWDRGGRRNAGTWWQNLAAPYADIPAERFVATLFSDTEMQRYVIGIVDSLLDALERHHRTCDWKGTVGAHPGWEIFIWYWDMLACEFQSPDEGTPYMDIIEDKATGKVLLQLANRRKDSDALARTLQRIGCGGKTAGQNGYVLLEELPTADAETVGARVNYWISQIGG